MDQLESIKDYEDTSSKVYLRQSYVSGENAIAAAILVLAEAISTMLK